jgi:hypothetical protein
MAKSKQKDLWTREPENLAEVVQISRQFLRSIRLDSDLGREDALTGYICQGTARSVLEGMAVQLLTSKQRAFTWTGPYGGGKSSLALLLCSLLGSNKGLRERARALVDAAASPNIAAAFEATGDGWLVVPVVGRRARASDVIGAALTEATHRAKAGRTKLRSRDVIGELVSVAEGHPQGVLVVIDELGKLLESAAQEGEDVYFFQELAEAASRCQGRLVIVGILHQAFDAYATRLGREARDDWTKVQGRYVDIPLVAATDEVVELIGKAIEVDRGIDHRDAEALAKTVAQSIKTRRPGSPADLAGAIARCWPLHPVVAALLGPISRRRFSQNERSTFGFLASREPLGFMEFLSGSPVHWASMYGPGRYWDYLSTNLEQAILASPDGHRWAVAADAIERASFKGSALHVEITKAVALIEIFRGGSGLVPELDVLTTCVAGRSRAEILGALKDLIDHKVLIERKHLGAYGIFAGSDFDIEGAIQQARTDIGAADLAQISNLADLQPVVAKRVYHLTGNMRWFTRHLLRVEEASKQLESFKPQRGSAGAFWLCVPDIGTTTASAKARIRKLSEQQGREPIIFGIPENGDRLADLSLEFVACDRVLKYRPELEGDTVARKELVSRLSTVQSQLEEELGEAFNVARWFWDGLAQEADTGGGVTTIASKVAQQIYNRAPVLRNELVNRESPSSNSSRARKDLMYRMAQMPDKAFLGYEGFPADAGIYYSLMAATGLHRPRGDDAWGFGEPYATSEHESLFMLWLATKDLVLKEQTTVKLADLYTMWGSPPYGVRAGVMPLIAMAFFLANRACLALYISDVFTPDLTESQIDEWLHDPSRINFRYVSASRDSESYLNAVLASIPGSRTISRNLEPLDVARALVATAVNLPNWTRRTTTISAPAQGVRGMLLKASDPHKVLFADLPVLLQADKPEQVRVALSELLEELCTAYPKLLEKVKHVLMSALAYESNDFSHLRARAVAVKGIAGEFRLEAFITRLESFDGSSGAVEGLLSLASNKPPAQWVDRDIDAALIQLGTWAHDFRRAETLAPLRGRPSTRRALGVVFGAGMGRDATATVDIDERDASVISRLAAQVLASLQQQRSDIALAALAEAGTLLLKIQQEESVK